MLTSGFFIAGYTILVNNLAWCYLRLGGLGSFIEGADTMKTPRKQAKDWLDNATREEIKYTIRQAMFSKTQLWILLMRKRKKSIVSISLRLHCDISTVNREIMKIYDKVFKVVYLAPK